MARYLLEYNYGNQEKVIDILGKLNCLVSTKPKSIAYGVPKVKTKCSKHPKYKVILEPRCDCEECWALWKNKNKKSAIEIEADDNFANKIEQFKDVVQLIA